MSCNIKWAWRVPYLTAEQESVMLEYIVDNHIRHLPFEKKIWLTQEDKIVLALHGIRFERYYRHSKGLQPHY